MRNLNCEILSWKKKENNCEPQPHYLKFQLSTSIAKKISLIDALIPFLASTTWMRGTLRHRLLVKYKICLVKFIFFNRSDSRFLVFLRGRADVAFYALWYLDQFLHLLLFYSFHDRFRIFNDNFLHDFWNLVTKIN